MFKTKILVSKPVDSFSEDFPPLSVVYITCKQNFTQNVKSFEWNDCVFSHAMWV